MAVLALVFVAEGHWLAICPRPDCTNAEHCGPCHCPSHNGHVGGLTAIGFTCSNCQLTCGAVWPPNVDDIDYVLSQRPVPQTRNWLPQRGETIHDLLRENAEKGLFPDPGEDTETRTLLAAAGDHITVGRELVAAHRKAIGGR